MILIGSKAGLHDAKLPDVGEPQIGSTAMAEDRPGALLPASKVAIFGKRQRRHTLEELAR